jgi:hypothetical protein
MNKLLIVACSALAFVSLGCAARKPASHFGTGVNFPVFKGPADFVRSFNRVAGIVWFHRLDRKKIDPGWIDPKFREKICLTVTIANHCGGG